MPVLNRAPPDRTRFYVESTNAKALIIRKVRAFTAHIYCLQIKAGMCCRTFQLECLWARFHSVPGDLPGGGESGSGTLGFEGESQSGS